MVCWRSEVIPLLARATVTRVALSMAYSSTTIFSTAKAATIVMLGTLLVISVVRHPSYLIILSTAKTAMSISSIIIVAMSVKRRSCFLIKVVFEERLTRSTLRTSALGTSKSTFIMAAPAFIPIATD